MKTSIFLILSAFCLAQAGVMPFKSEDLDNNAFNIEDHLGNKVILINFWATYCIPCLAEMDKFQNMYEKHKDKGFLLVAISVDKPQTVARVRTFIKSKKFTYPVLLDTEQKVYNLYNVSALPTNILIDRRGKIVRRKESYHQGEEAVWDSLVAFLIEQKDSTPESARGEISLTGSNFLRTNYGRENRTQDLGAKWLEDWFDFQIQKSRLSYKTRFRAYQHLWENPDNHDAVVSNANHRTVKHLLNFDGDNVKVQAGNIYTNIGRGLILRTFEDRTARIDKDMKGVRAGLHHPGLPLAGKSSMNIFGGSVFDRFTNLYELDADEENQRNTYLQGVEGSIKPLPFLKLSAQTMEAFRDKPSQNSLFIGTSAQGNLKLLEYYLGFVDVKREDRIEYPHEFNGNALYASLSLNLNKLELGGEYKIYKNYNYDFTDPPNLLKYHTFRLMARNLVISNNQWEEGGQINGTYHFNKDLSYGLNLSMLETHAERNYIDMVFHEKLPFLDIDQILRLPLNDRGRLLLELNINMQEKFDKELSYPTYWTSNVIPERKLGSFTEGFLDINSYTIGVLWDQKISKNYAFQVESEYQLQTLDLNEYIKDSSEFFLDSTAVIRGDRGPTFFRDTVHNGVLMLSISRIARWSLSIDFELTTNFLEQDGESIYYKLPKISNGWSSIYFTYEFLKRHKATLWIGQRKGRVICSGGTCRVEPGFEGIEFIMTNYF
jgi:peroxiredoxin